MFYNKTSLITAKKSSLDVLQKCHIMAKGFCSVLQTIHWQGFYFNLIGIHIERTQRIHCLIQYTGGWAHISLMMFNDFKQTLLLFTHLFFIICLPINALNLFGFHVLECGTNTLATYPAFCTQPAGEGCRKNCNIVLTVICNIFFQVLK